jgi:hypothetical protein
MRTNGAGSWNLAIESFEVWSERRVRSLILAEFGGRGER